MIREIIHDPIMLKINSKEATADDMQIAIDLGFTAQIIQHEIDHCNGVLI